MRDPAIPYYTRLMKTDADRPCPQHHQPRSQCRPSDRHVHSMRFRDDDWENAEQAAWADRSDVTTLTTLVMEAMLGYIRCYRCRENAPPVPVEFGNLTGGTLREHLTDAEKRVVSQHPHHEPVTIGEPARTGSVVPVPDESLLRARARTRAGSAVFMEPGGNPHITPVPEVRDHGSKKGRR